MAQDGSVQKDAGEGGEQGARRRYAEEAKRIAGLLQIHLPGGLFDALFVELARRKASVYRVPLGRFDPPGDARIPSSFVRPREDERTSTNSLDLSEVSNG